MIMTKRATISVVIPCFNVEKFIQPTLDSITWCDEVVIVDMFSTDATKELCLKYPNVKFYENKDVIYANVNLGIDKATSDWILRLDSDELITDELRKEIETKILLNNSCDFDGFDAHQQVYFMGYLLNHGFGGDNWRGTLFRNGKARYATRSEHEDLVKEGKWGRLENKYLHYTNPTISMWVNKINYYSDKDIERWNPQTDEVMTMGKVIYRTARWFQRYYTYPHKAYKDGIPGLVVALIAAAGLMLGYLKQWEKQQRLIKGEDFYPNHPNARLTKKKN
jgi:glycosyltransferase involved in cell wall biosynthesis